MEEPSRITSDTKGVDFGPYLKKVLDEVRKHWYELISETAMPPRRKQGKVVLEFSIRKDGKVAGLRFSQGSGDIALDRAAYGGITASDPFPSLPSEFTGDSLGLRFRFLYNPGLGTVRLSEILVSTGTIPPGSDASPEIIVARARAEALLEQVHRGAKFEDVAKANSDGSTAALGGDVGYFSRGTLTKRMEDLVFGMKLGEVSDVIRTKQGFVILKVTDHREDNPATVAAHP